MIASLIRFETGKKNVTSEIYKMCDITFSTLRRYVEKVMAAGDNRDIRYEP